MATGYSFDSLSKIVDQQQTTLTENQKTLTGLTVPAPDFELPLSDDLTITRGIGSPYQIDVSPAQDGSVMVDLPMYKADFSRASTATYVNKQGVLVHATIDEPRFEAEGVLIEGGSTNIAPGSSDLDDWIIGGGSPATDITPILAGTVAKRLVPTMLGSSYCRRNITVKPDTNYTMSGWVRIGEDFPDSSKVLTGHIFSSSGITDTAMVQANGIPRNVWTRVSVSFTTPSDATYIGFHFGYDWGVGVAFDVSLPQLEELPFASSYIPTDEAAATRAADRVNLTGAAFSGEFTISLDCAIKSFSHAAIFDSKQVGSDTWFYLNETGVGVGANRLSNPTAIPISTRALAITSESLFIDGFTVGDYSDKLVSTGFTDLTLFTNLGNQSVTFGHIKNFRIWNHALTADQIAHL